LESEIIGYGTANGFSPAVCHDFFDHYEISNWLYGKAKDDISTAPKWKAALRRFSRHTPKKETPNHREIWMISADLKAVETEMRSMWSEYSFDYESGRARNPSKWEAYNRLKVRASGLRDELAVPKQDMDTPPVGPSAPMPPRQAC
jgi:hypothetical protein